MSKYNDPNMKRVVLYLTPSDYDALVEQARLRGLVVPRTGVVSVSAYIRLIARRYYRVVRCKRCKGSEVRSAWDESLT